MSAHTPKIASALTIGALTLLPLSVANAAPEPSPAATSAATAEPVKAAQAAEQTQSPAAAEPSDGATALDVKPVETKQPAPAEDEAPAPIDVTPLDPTPATTQEPSAPATEPAKEPTTEPTSGAAEPTATPVEVTPVVPAESQNEEPTPATVEPVEQPTATPSSPSASTEPTQQQSTDTNTENTTSDAPAASTTEAQPQEQQSQDATAAAGQPELDAQKNIVLTGTVVEEEVLDAATGSTRTVENRTASNGDSITTEYVTDPTARETKVTETVTNAVTGEKSTTTRHVPSTTFKAGAAASIQATASETDAKSNVVPGVLAGLGFILLIAGGTVTVYRRRHSTTN